MNLSVSAAFGYSVLGMIIVFLMLVMIMLVIMIFAKIPKKDIAEKPAVTQIIPAPALMPVQTVMSVAPAVQKRTVMGSSGEVKIYDVPEKTAAILMAIIANKTGVPLNELRFISVRQLDE